MYTGCHCPVTAGQKGGGVWEMDIRDPPWAQTNFPPPQGMGVECGVPPPPPLCNSYALVIATVGVGTVLILYFGVAITKGGGYGTTEAPHPPPPDRRGGRLMLFPQRPVSGDAAPAPLDAEQQAHPPHVLSHVVVGTTAPRFDSPASRPRAVLLSVSRPRSGGYPSTKSITCGTPELSTGSICFLFYAPVPRSSTLDHWMPLDGSTPNPPPKTASPTTLRRVCASAAQEGLVALVR